MTGFALYRLPHATHAIFVQQTQGEPDELLSCQELNGRQGFVMAPFEITPSQPILLIRPDVVQIIGLSMEEIASLAPFPRKRGGNGPRRRSSRKGFSDGGGYGIMKKRRAAHGF